MKMRIVGGRGAGSLHLKSDLSLRLFGKDHSPCSLSFKLTNCVWMNKNSSPESMSKVYLSWRIMFDMVCEPL